MNHPDGFNVDPTQPRPGTGNNINGSKTLKGRGWNLPILRAAKLFGWQSALQRAKSEARLVLNRHWNDNEGIGVGPKNLSADIRRLMPYVDEVFSELGRKPIEDRGSGIINRVYYMYHHVDTRRPEISVEHPLRSETLRPYLQAAIDLFVKGKPIPRETIEELFKDAE